MKFSCKTQDLLQGIHTVSRAIGGQQTLPILGNILIEVEGKRCQLSATDLELSIITSFEANIENEGSITVPAKAIINFAQYNSDDEVVLETVEGSQLRCTSNSAKTVIAGEQASEFPTITPVSKETAFGLEGKPLLEALSKVTFASAKTTLRPVLSGVFFQIEKNEAVLVATDSYRLSEYKISISDSKAQNVSCIIPAKVLDELRSVLSSQKGSDKSEKADKKKKDGETKESPAGDVQVVLNPQQIELQVGQTRLLSRLIEGKFPDYKQIIPKESETDTVLPLQELLTTTKRMHYFAKEMNNNLLFNCTKNAVEMSTLQTQIGKDEASIETDIKGKENKIALSSTYLLDFLSHIEGESVAMYLTDSMHPAVFKLPENDAFLHLIMPLRLQEE